MSALLTFLGGSAFRMLWGEISAGWTKYQDHKHELEMMKLQNEHDEAQHRRTLEQQRLAHEQGIKIIEAKSDAAVEELEVQAWLERVKSIEKPVGIDWVDAWRACIQPALATVAILLWVSALNSAGFVMTEWDRELVAAILGMYSANRILKARGK